MSLIAVSAFTPPSFGGTLGVILVPRRSGANVLRIQTGMPHGITARRVFGCKTLAPKYASSLASRYEISGMMHALGTRRGSAVSRPSTSVQMMNSLAPTAAHRLDAE